MMDQTFVLTRLEGRYRRWYHSDALAILIPVSRGSFIALASDRMHTRTISTTFDEA